jgi:hypothetical protein
VISPTIGQIVWFHRKGSQPHEVAIVTAVHSDIHVNLTVFGYDGDTRSERTVQLAQDGVIPPVGPYCRWMPYQIGQAKKHAI